MRFRTTAAVASSAVLALGAAACGSSSKSSGGGSSSGSTSTKTAPAQPQPVASIPTLTGVNTAVKLDAGFVKALTALKVTPGVTGKAKLSGGSVKFPITGGNVKYFKPGTVSPYVQGMIMHNGSGLSLTAGGKKVKLQNFLVDPGASVLTGKVSVNGKVAAPSAPLFVLDGRTLQPLRVTSDGRAVLQGTTVKLKAEAADLLNKTFGIQDLKPGLVIGVAKIVVNTK